MAEDRGLIRGLFVGLGYDYDEEDMKRFDQGVKNTQRLMKGTALVAIGLAAAFGTVFKVLSSGQRELRRNALNLGVEADQLEGILRLSEQVTGQREAALGILNQLAQARRRLIAGEGIDEGLAIALQQLGISVDQLGKLKPDQLLFAINDALVDLDKTQQEIVLHRLGFSEYTDFLTEVNLRQKTAAQGISRNRDQFLQLEKAVTRVKQGFEDAFLALGQEQVDDIVQLLTTFANTVLPTIVEQMAAISGYINDMTESFKKQEGFLFGLSKIWDGFKAVVEFIAEALAEITLMLQGLSNNEFLNVLGKIARAPLDLVSAASETLGGVTADVVNFVSGPDLIPLTPVPAAAAGISNQTSTKIVQNDVTMYVDGGDPRRIKQEFDKATENESRTLNQQTRSPLSN